MLMESSDMVCFDATAIILAGGKSSRMGRDKSLLTTDNIPLIKKIASQLDGYFKEIIIGANDVEKYRFLQLPVVPDLVEGKGPLMGIYSTLLSSKHEINFVIACDIPDLDMNYITELIRQAKDYQVVIPAWSDGRLEPLFAVYKKSILSNIKELIDADQRKIRLLFESVDVKYMPLPDEAKWYRNLNTMEDYQNYIKK
ncbi:MAG: molybdenum cofactor guanylyltransferase [Smithella sp.]